jgi:hypothetical protein
LEETLLVNAVKERLCFTSVNFDRDLATCRRSGAANSIRREYVLPTDVGDPMGHVKVFDVD